MTRRLSPLSSLVPLVLGLSCGGETLRGAEASDGPPNQFGSLIARFTVQRCRSSDSHPVRIEHEQVELREEKGRAYLFDVRPLLLPIRVQNGVRQGQSYQFQMVFESTDEPLLVEYAIPAQGEGRLVWSRQWTERPRAGGFAVVSRKPLVTCELVRQTMPAEH